MTAGVSFAFAQAVVVMSLLGYFVIDLILPPKAISRWFVWALAPAMGAGICSFLLFLFRRPMFTVERGLLLVLFVIWIWRRGKGSLDFSKLTAWRAPLLGVLFAGALGLMLAESLERIGHIPHGGVDGFSIWNSHSRYLYRDGPGWQQHIQNTFHSDYPLLLPLNVVRLWRYADVEVPDLGAVLGVLFTFSAVILVCAALAEMRGTSTGILMALTLLTTSAYMVQGTYQEADVPLSLYLLGTLALLYLSFEREEDGHRILVPAGFLAGCAAWTKNEGVLFLATVSVVLILPVFWKPRVTLRRAGLFAAGLLLPLAALLYFKLTIAPQTDLFQNRQSGEVVAKFLNLDRHGITFGSFLQQAWTFGGWAIHPLIPLSAFLFWKGVDRQTLRSSGWWAGVATLAIVLLGYYSIYVFTPMDLKWHIESSLPRLLMQVWPSVILMAGLSARGDRQLAAYEGVNESE